MHRSPVDRWITVIDDLAPPPSTDDAAVFRHRFTVVACGLGGLVGLVTALAFFWAGDHQAARSNACYAALTGVPLVALRRRAASGVAFWYQQVLTAVTFDVLAWTTSPLDWTIPMWLAILPLTAILYGGARHGVASGLLATASFGAMRVSGPLDLSGAPAHEVSSTVRFITFLGAAGLIAWVFDSLRRAAVARAEAAATARTIFFASVSHELRTPLNAIVGLTEVLRHSEPREDQRGQLELLGASAQTLIDLINDILDFARIDSGRFSLDPVPFEPRRIARDLERLFEPVAQRAGLALTVSVDDSVPRCLVGDPARIRQVLTNLLDNALKFTRQGTVELVMQRRRASFEVSVTDTGVGMDSATLARLFTPFAQAEAPPRRGLGGAGLGLAISRHLADRMGGTLEVSSSFGEGSTFTFSCPLEEGTSDPPAPSEPPDARALDGAAVLIVDDNATNRLVAELLLRKAGCKTLLAESGREALSIVAGQTPDFVLMDCHMPELDGLETTRRIRALSGPGRDVVIIAMTASALPEEIDRCRASGMDGCLSKPFTLDALIRTLTRAGSFDDRNRAVHP